MGIRKTSLVAIGALFLLLPAWTLSSASSHTYLITMDSDDGTEANVMEWLQDGVDSGNNYLGRGPAPPQKYDIGLRYHLDDLEQGDEITFARLRFSSYGGEINSSVQLIIEGVLQESPTTFSSNERPSQKLPKTQMRIEWIITENWIKGKASIPVWYSSPNIASILNEILGMEGWGTGPEGKTLIITIRDGSGSSETNYVAFDDFIPSSGQDSPVVLEIYKDVYSTFLGRELVGRVTGNSAAVSLYSLIETDLYIEYGEVSGQYDLETDHYHDNPAETGIELVLNNLDPNTRYYYRLRYRKAGTGDYEAGEERTFHTQRSSGMCFSYAIQSDEHLMSSHKLPPNQVNMELYQTMLQNIAEDNPDFFISLGDFAHTEYTTGRNAVSLADALERYLLQRRYIDEIAHSTPFYLVIGNHEGEQGWYSRPENEDDIPLSTLSTLARKEIIPNPVPDGFYTGNTDWVVEHEGLREDYFAWEWGEALFVVLAPYWYTKEKPAINKNGWAWTLGKEQYDWLFETLHGSGCRWKFVFIHHLVTTTTNLKPAYINPFYGRGGIEVAKFIVDGNPSFEWGGEDETGNYVFDVMRPGWNHGPIHDMLVDEQVTIVFHGHDHVFAKQDLDGIVYQECPQPIDAKTWGYKTAGGYIYGDFVKNSGHLLVTVDAGFVNVKYIRCFLPETGKNGIVSYEYTIY